MKTRSMSKLQSVQELYIYPIKSCAEIQVNSAKVTPIGFEHDRIMQVVSKVDSKDSPFDPDYGFCTPRERKYEKLFHVQPTLITEERTSTTLELSSKYVEKSLWTSHAQPTMINHEITTPTTLELSSKHVEKSFRLKLEEKLTLFGSLGHQPVRCKTMGWSSDLLEDCGLHAAKWLEEATGVKGCRLVGLSEHNSRYVLVNPKQGEEIPQGLQPRVSLADEAPFLLTTRSSLADLNKRLGKRNQVDMRRFRPNIVIDGFQPWEEDSFKRIRIGAVEFHVWQRCGRCTMTTIDRDSLERCGEPLKTLSTFRERENGQRNFGMHLIPVRPWELKGEQIFVGDRVEVLEYDEERRAEWMRLFGESS